MNDFCLRTHQGSEITLNRDGNYLIGGAQADIIVSGAVDRHATLIRVRDRVMIKPEQGTVSVNGQPINRMVTLKSGDQIQIGGTKLELIVGHSSAPPPAPTAAGSVNFSRSGPSFALDEALFDEPTTPPPPISNASSVPSPPAVNADKPSTPPVAPPKAETPPAVDQFLQGIQTPSAPQKPRQIVPAAPNKPKPTPPISPSQIGASGKLTDDQCRTVLTAYFHKSQIYTEKAGGGVELNFVERWGRTHNNFGRTWVIATEGLKLGFKAMQWLSSMENRDERPADYVDAAIAQTIQNCVDVAYDRLMMQPTLVKDPLVIYGPIFWREPGIPIENICARKGDDGFVRFSAQQVSILVLDDEQIGVFVCALDTITGQIGAQKARSYNYKDIVSVADEDTTIEVEMQDGTKKVNVYAFNIEVSSGRNLSITLNSPMIRDLFDGDALEQPEHEQTVRVIRQMWRTKKNT